jgi:ferredoxin, 2Fe-2S
VASVKVTFVHPDGSRETHQAVDGETLLDCALDHGVVGLRGQCGGACTCVTCHCYIDAPWANALPAAQADELEMLDYAPARRAESRLACQIVLRPGCDGIEVMIPAAH